MENKNNLFVLDDYERLIDCVLQNHSNKSSVFQLAEVVFQVLFDKKCTSNADALCYHSNGILLNQRALGLSEQGLKIRKYLESLPGFKLRQKLSNSNLEQHGYRQMYLGHVARSSDWAALLRKKVALAEREKLTLRGGLWVVDVPDAL